MAPRIILTQTDKCKDIPKNCRRELDREELIKLLLINDIQPLSLEAEGSKLIWVFTKEEVSPIEDRLIKNEVIMVPWHKVLQVNGQWKDALAMLRSRS
jgi:hypothetical protein